MTPVTTFLTLALVAVLAALALITAKCSRVLKTAWLPLLPWILLLLAIAVVLLNIAGDASAAV